MNRFFPIACSLLSLPAVFVACGEDAGDGNMPLDPSASMSSTTATGTMTTSAPTMTTSAPTMTTSAPTMTTSAPTMTTSAPTMTGSGGMPGNGGSGGTPPVGGMGGTPGDACADLTGTGPAALPPIQIAEIAAGEHILLFNQTDNAVTLTELQLCANFVFYQTVTALTDATEIPAKGYLKLDWHETLDAANITAQDGELLLFTELIPIPSASSDLLDYVCWGDGLDEEGDETQGRRPDGMMVYPGDCLGELSNGALRRLPMTTGTDAASYDASASPSTGECVAE